MPRPLGLRHLPCSAQTMGEHTSTHVVAPRPRDTWTTSRPASTQTHSPSRAHQCSCTRAQTVTRTGGCEKFQVELGIDSLQDCPDAEDGAPNLGTGKKFQ
ncbi:hypothetical protein EJB05_41664 [Eragrostis curvula]|uniref:Uncharacterized protein n=1 Tax=Eragrostis curvula TaxID=38414 RepID=A0A5J9TA72_9POAL|nr:hypothetical protein EJB05_41664 [Eragrostis curvula]